MIIGQAIKAARMHHNLSQEQLADKCGLKRSNISRIERKASDKTIYLGTLELIAGALGYPTWRLMKFAETRLIQAAEGDCTAPETVQLSTCNR